jgi:hypothetical protein
MVGVPEHLIMAQVGHKKSDTTKKHICIPNRWEENVAMKLGLEETSLCAPELAKFSGVTAYPS